MSQDDSADKYLEIAQKLRKTHKLSEAEKQLVSALEEYPEDAELLSEAASVYHELGKKEDAASYMERALEVDPEKTIPTISNVVVFGMITLQLSMVL